MSNRTTSSAVFREDNRGLGFSLWDGFAALMVMLFQVTWIIPMYQLVISWEGMSSQIKLALALSPIFILAYLMNRGLQQLAIGDGAMQLAETLLLLGSVYGSMQLLLVVPTNPEQTRVDPRTGVLVEGTRVPADMLIIFLAVVAMWQLGGKLGRHGVRQMEAQRNFRFGLIMWLIIIFASTSVEYEIPLYLLFSSLFGGLVGMAFARVGSVNRLKGGGKIHYSRRWITKIFAGVGGVVVVSALLGVTLGGAPAKALLGEGLRQLILWLTRLLQPFLLLIDKLLTKLVIGFGRVFREGSDILDEGDLPSLDFPEEITENPIPFLPPDLQTILPFLGGLILFVLILRGIWSRHGVRAGELMFYDDEWERGNLFDGLRSSVADLGESLGDNLRSWRDKYLRSMLAKARVRRMYARFLGLCEDLEIPRGGSQTPLEFVQVAGRKLSGCYDDIEILTRAYIRVRYGEIPETDEEVEAILAAWKRIRAAGEALRKGSRALKNRGDEGLDE